MSVRYRPQAAAAELHRLIDADRIRQLAANDAAPVTVIGLSAENDPGTATVIVVEHRSELHVLLPTDTAPIGLPAASLLETHMAQRVLELVTDPDFDPDDYPNATAVSGLFAAAGAGLHDADPVALQRLGQAIGNAVQTDPHAIAMLEEAMIEPFDQFLTAWLLTQLQLPPTDAGLTDEEDEPPFFTPEQNRALLDAGAATGISPYGLMRLSIVIGADTEPGFISPLPKQTAATSAAIYDALQDAIPEVNIRYDLSQILAQELGIPIPAPEP